MGHQRLLTLPNSAHLLAYLLVHTYIELHERSVSLIWSDSGRIKTLGSEKSRRNSPVAPKVT